MARIAGGDAEKGGTWGPRDVAEAWDRGAAARARAFGAATETMLELANVTRGSRVLDIAAGAGDQTLMAARRVGPTGYVLATDISANMVELAALAARRAGLTNVDTRMMDAQRLEVDAESFDAVISRFGLMLIPDPHRALTEIRRVLRGGGKVAAIVFSTPDQCPYLSIPHAIARRVGRLTASPEPFAEFRLSGPGVLEDAYSKAGFHDVAVHQVPTRRTFPSVTEAVEYAKALPVRELMAQLSESEQRQAWAEIEVALRQFEGPNGYESPCMLLIAVGTK
jgi:ubiquinone/menaquinone biosynthesis C-methylase UbiE